MMTQPSLFERYQLLQDYIGWSDQDVKNVVHLGPAARPCFPWLVQDFYDTIQRFPQLGRLLEGPPQIERLKQSLLRWLEELFSGVYDAAYVDRRWRVGKRHVEIGLEQIFTNVAFSRLRNQLFHCMDHGEPPTGVSLIEGQVSLNKLLDLDLAIIEDAYQSEYALRLQRVERLATLGQVSGGIAHELRNPLNVMKTSVYYLRNAKSASPEKTAEHLERIERQVGQADRVITALADFSKLPLPQVRPLSIEDCLQGALADNPLPDRVMTQIDCPPTLPEVLGDYEQLRIVFGNLIRNASDAMPQGGQLQMHARQDGDYIEIDVRDTGIGIRSEDLERIMEPLFSTKSRGLGLGLAITRAIIDRHQGALRIQSTVGSGSQFSVRLPAAPSRNVAS